MPYRWGQTAAKKMNVTTLNSAHQVKKSSANLTVAGSKDNRAVCVASSKFSEPKEFVWYLNKVEGKYIQGQQQN